MTTTTVTAAATAGLCSDSNNHNKNKNKNNAGISVYTTKTVHCSETTSTTYDNCSSTVASNNNLNNDGICSTSSIQEKQNQTAHNTNTNTNTNISKDENENSSHLDWTFLKEGRLFDREKQQQQLLDSFYRQMDNDNEDNNYADSDDDDDDDDSKNRNSNRSGNNNVIIKEFVIVSGLSGTGKTILVEETLKRPLMERGGFFLKGKLDQLNSKKTLMGNSNNNNNNSDSATTITTTTGVVDIESSESESAVAAASTSTTAMPQRPYAPFHTAFETFVDSVMAPNNFMVAEDILSLVSSAMPPGDIDLLVDTFPPLRRVLKPDDNDNDSKIDGPNHIHKCTPSSTSKNLKKSSVSACFCSPVNQKQLVRIVCIFLNIVSDPHKRPIVLFIDDLQWADQGTLVLLESLLISDGSTRTCTSTSSTCSNNNNGLFLIGTCRHNEVTVHHGLATLLRRLEDDPQEEQHHHQHQHAVQITQIEVSNLSKEVCGEIFARVMGIPQENYHYTQSLLAPLVNIAYERTKGNAFFLLQFIQLLHDEGYLQVKQGQRQQQYQIGSDTGKYSTNDISDVSSTATLSSTNGNAQIIDQQQQQQQRQQKLNHRWSWNEDDIIRSSLLHQDTMQDNRSTDSSSSHAVDSIFTDAATTILIHQMRRLPAHVQETLRVASCLGSEFDEQLLYDAMIENDSNNNNNNNNDENNDIIIISESLEILLSKDYIRIHPSSMSGGSYRTGSCRRGSYRMSNSTTNHHFQFVHDKIQKASIGLITQNNMNNSYVRSNFCTNIGRKLLSAKNTSINANNDNNISIFLIMNLLSHGISSGIIVDPIERQQVATLALEAGESAANMSDFIAASSYLNIGINCLKNNHSDQNVRDHSRNKKNGYYYWKENGIESYDLALSLFNLAAEMEHCTANVERMEIIIKEIILNARSFHDKIRVYKTMIYSLGSRMRLQEAIALGFSLLEILGERFPIRPLKIFILLDLLKTKKMLKNHNKNGFCDIDDYNKLKEMNNKDKIAVMNILDVIFPYCMASRHPRTGVAIFRMVQLTVKYGYTPASATGFAAYGTILCGLGEFLNGNRYGKVALRLLDTFGATHLISRVYTLYYGYISNWNTPLRMNLIPIMDAHRIGLTSGDTGYAMVNAALYSTNAFHSGKRLDTLEIDVYRLLELCYFFRQTTIISIMRPILQQIYNLRRSREQDDGNALTDHPWILTGKACDEDIVMAQAKASNNVICLCQFYFRKLWMAYVFNTYDLAYIIAQESRKTISSQASFMVFSHHFFEAMTCMALAMTNDTSPTLVSFRTSTKIKTNQYLRRARQCLKIMVKRGGSHCKLNCLNKVLMVEAEILVFKGNLKGALELYEKSAALSETGGFMHEHAIAYERAGLAVMYHHSYHQNRLDRIRTKDTSTTKAGAYINKSINLYRIWGATAKVDQMLLTQERCHDGHSCVSAIGIRN